MFTAIIVSDIDVIIIGPQTKPDDCPDIKGRTEGSVSVRHCLIPFKIALIANAQMGTWTNFMGLDKAVSVILQYRFLVWG